MAAGGALWRRRARAEAMMPPLPRPPRAAAGRGAAAAVLLSLSLVLLLAGPGAAGAADAAAPLRPVAVRLSGGVGTLGGYTVSATVNGAPAPRISLAVDSGSTLSFVEPLGPGRRLLPPLGDPLPCEARSCPCDIACGNGCDLPLPAYAAGAFRPPPSPSPSPSPAPAPSQSPAPAAKAPAAAPLKAVFPGLTESRCGRVGASEAPPASCFCPLGARLPAGGGSAAAQSATRVFRDGSVYVTRPWMGGGKRGCYQAMRVNNKERICTKVLLL